MSRISFPNVFDKFNRLVTTDKRHFPYFGLCISFGPPETLEKLVLKKIKSVELN